MKQKSRVADGDGCMDAIVLGASTNALSVARSLGRAGLRVTVAETTDNRPVRSSCHVHSYVVLNDVDDADIARQIVSLAGNGEKPFLIATSDRFAMLVARFQGLLRQHYHFVTPAFEVIEAIIDKAALYETARAHGIPQPAFHVVASSSDIEPAVRAVPTPCYVKPALGYRWRRFKHGKLERAATATDLRRILGESVAHNLVVIAQEIIPGPDSGIYSVFAYIDRSGRCIGSRTKRKLRQWPLNAGNGCCQEICEQPEVADLGLRLLALTGHRGPATVEFRRDERDGRFVLIEVNARTSACQELMTRSGLDAALIAYHDALGMPPPPVVPPLPARWVHLGDDFRAFRALRRAGQTTTLRWLASVAKCRSFAYFALDDLAPFFATLLAWAGRWRRRHPWMRAGERAHASRG